MKPWELRLTRAGLVTRSRYSTALAAREARQGWYAADEAHIITRAQITNTITGLVLPELPVCAVRVCRWVCSERTSGMGANLCEDHYTRLLLTEQHAYGVYRHQEVALERYRWMCARAGICAAPLCWLPPAASDLDHCQIHQETP